MFGIILPFSVRYKQQCLIQWHQVSNFRCLFCFALHRTNRQKKFLKYFSLSFKFLSGFSLEIIPPNSFEYYCHLQLLMKSLWNWHFGISAFRRTWKVKRRNSNNYWNRKPSNAHNNDNMPKMPNYRQWQLYLVLQFHELHIYFRVLYYQFAQSFMLHISRLFLGHPLKFIEYNKINAQKWVMNSLKTFFFSANLRIFLWCEWRTKNM